MNACWTWQAVGEIPIYQMSVNNTLSSPKFWKISSTISSNAGVKSFLKTLTTADTSEKSRLP